MDLGVSLLHALRSPLGQDLLQESFGLSKLFFHFSQVLSSQRRLDMSFIDASPAKLATQQTGRNSPIALGVL